MNIYILGLEDGFRGSGLKSLAQSDLDNVDIIWGQDSRKDHCRFSRIQLTLQKHLNGRRISLGEYYCAKGHDLIYRRFLQSESEWALILEEDVTAAKNLDEIRMLVKNFSAPSIIHLGGISQVLNNSPNETFWVRRIFTVASPHGNDHVIAQVKGNVFGAYAYLINRTAAMIAVDGNERLKQPQLADWPATWRSKVNFYLTKEMYFHVELQNSLIKEERDEYSRSSNRFSSFSERIKIFGWMRIFFNLSLITPSIRRFSGVNFKSVLHDNLYLYFYARLLFRIRDHKVMSHSTEKNSASEN